MEKRGQKRLVYRGKSCSADSVKKHVDFQGIKVCIDRPKGSKMSGKDEKGETWERTYKYDYGFIPKTLGGDDDGIDVFIGPEKGAEQAYWAIQNKPDGSFDEYKVFLGFPNREAAIGTYKDHIPQKLFSGLVTMRVSMMRAMLGKDPGETLKTAMIVSFQDELSKIAELSEIKDKLRGAGKRTQEAVRKGLETAKHRMERGPERTKQLIELAEYSLEPVVGEIN